MFSSILFSIFILHVTVNYCIIKCEAALASPFPFAIPLPDGTMSDNMTIVGSPAFFQTYDERGYTVMVDPKDKFVKYAVVDATTGQIKPSKMKMRKGANPDRIGIKQGVQPTEEAKRENCGEYCENEVKVHEFVIPRGTCERFCSIKGGISRRLQYWSPGLADLMLPDSWIEEDNSDVDDEQHQRRRNLSSVGGKLVNLVVPIRFADHASRKMIFKKEIDILFNAVNGHEKLAPTGSIRDVFAYSSYGKLIIESTVVDWITLSNTESFYAGGKSGLSEAFSAGLKEALDHLENDPTFDFANFDRNGDRKIDAITFLHSGYGAEMGGVDCSTGNDSKERIWSHKWKLKPEVWKSKKSGVIVSDYVASPSLHGTCGNEIGRIGTLAHEMGHFIGLPDVYGAGPPHGGYGIGSFSLMSNSWGFDGSQLNPPILSAWDKMEIGWLTPDIISASGYYELPPIGDSPKAYKIMRGFASDEFLLIENRAAMSSHAKMPKSGLLIWHIDNEASHRPEGVVGPKGTHYRVSLVQADGNHELELGVNRGDEGDIFGAGNILGIGFTGEGDPTYPNTDSYRGGALTPTGISISSISDPDENGYVRFSVTFPGDPLPAMTPPTPAPISEPKLELVRTELMTTFAGGTGSYGVMFDAIAIKGLTITSADLHLNIGEDDGEKAIEIYTAVDTHLGIEKSPDKWTKVCCARKVVGKGLMKRTSIDSSLWLQQVNMSPGERRAWYITSDEPIIRYSRSEKTDCCEVFANSAHLQIEEGQGVGGYPWGNRLKPRIWNGVFHYETMDVVRSDTNPVPAGSLPDPDSVKVTPTKHFSGNSGSFGIMFDVIPRKKMTIVGLDFHTESTDVLEVEVWYKKGSHVGFERDQMSWTEVSYARIVGQGPYKRTSIDPSFFNAILVDSFERISFYVTLMKSPKMRYTKEAEDTRAVVGDIDSSSEDMDILVGGGVASYPFGYFFSPRFPNNNIHYVLDDEADDASEETPTQTLPSGVYGIGDKKEISTTFSSGNGGYGAMFDIECKSETGDLVISSMDFHTDLVGVDINVKIFTISGSYVGYGYQSEAWNIVADTTVKGEGYYKRTVVPSESFEDVVILNGNVQAFYVTIDKPNLRYSNAKNVGDVWVQSEEENEIVIKVGAGLGGGLASFSSLFEPRVMNGVIHYHLRYQQTSPPTSAAPILPKSPTSTTGSLKTEQDFEAGSYGVIFSVRNKGLSTIHITGLWIYSDFIGDFGVEVYALEGGFLGEPVASQVQIASTTISGSSSESLIQIPLQNQVEVGAGQRQTVYVTLDRPSLQYTMGADEGSVSISDEYIEISDGSGVLGYPLSSSNVRSGRRFVGIVDYRVEESAISSVGSTIQASVMPDMTSSTETNPGQFLTTSFQGALGAYGALFDVTNVRDSQEIMITKLDLHASGEDSLRCEVWYRRGSSLDYPWNTNGGGWIMVANENLVPEAESGKSLLARFSEDKFTRIEMDPGELVGLLVQCEEERTRYSIFVSSGSDKIVAIDGSLMIEAGYGVTLYPLSARVQFDRAFEGVIHYSEVNVK